MSPLDTQFDEETAEPEQGLVPFLGHMIPEKNARELQLFLDETRIFDPQQLAQYITTKPDGTVQITWPCSLYLNDSKITAIPSGFHVLGTLHLERCTELKYLPPHLYVSGDLKIRHCKKLTELPEFLIVDGDLNADYSGLASFPINVEVKGKISTYKCYFGLRVEMFKRLYLRHSNNTEIEDVFGVKITPDLSQEEFLRTAIAYDERARKFFLNNFSEFRELPCAVEVGFMASMEQYPLANLQNAFLENHKEQSVTQLREYFDIKDAEPSEALLNHADFVVEACVRSIKAEATLIQKLFDRNPENHEVRQHCLKKAREVHPRHVHTLKLILPENIIRRLMARGTSAESLKFLLT